MRAELDEQDLERIAQEIEREALRLARIVAGDLQHWIGISTFLILSKLNELETQMAALDDAVARSVASQEALLAAFNASQANQNPQGAIDQLNAESDKVDAAVAAVPAA